MSIKKRNFGSPDPKEKAAFMAHLRENPVDHVSRKVYADWLMENGLHEDSEKQSSISEFLENENPHEVIQGIMQEGFVPYVSPDREDDDDDEDDFRGDHPYPVGGTILSDSGTHYVIPDPGDVHGSRIEQIENHINNNSQVNSYSKGNLFFANDSSGSIIPPHLYKHFRESMAEKGNHQELAGDYDGFYVDPDPKDLYESLLEAHEKHSTE